MYCGLISGFDINTYLMVQLFPVIHILNPYWSHIVVGGQHGNYKGPISVSRGGRLTRSGKSHTDSEAIS